MATRALFRINGPTNKCFHKNVPYNKTNFQVSNLFIPVRGFRRLIRDVKDKKPVVNFTNKNGPMPLRFWKMLGITVAFSGASIVGATIWNYERIRMRTYNLIHQYHKHLGRKKGLLEGRVEAWWKGLTLGERTFVPICLLNILVFIGWRIPAFSNVMNRYFMTNPCSSVVGLPMLLSVFSHYSSWHLAANMYVLHTFCTPAVQILGPEQFIAMYLISGVVGNFTSHVYKVCTLQQRSSLGASGAIMGVLGFTCTDFPTARLSLIFLPMVVFTTSQALKAVITLDLAGAILRWKLFDHAAHLGGIFTGIFWEKWGRENIWHKRKPLVTYWHKLRGPLKST